MDEQQKIDFVFEAGKVLPPLCHKFVTRVVAVRKDDGWDHRGTALMILLNGQQLFVTALHVLTEIEKEKNYRSFGLSCVAEDGRVDIHRFDDIDVVVFIPENKVEPKHGEEFWPSEQTDFSSNLLIADYLLVHGYPDTFTHYTTFLPGFVAEGYTHCASIRLRESALPVEALAIVKEQFPNYMPVPDSLMKPSQFAINYAEDTGPLKNVEGEEVIDESILKDHSHLYSDGVSFSGQKKHGAFGLSGSPVWRFGANESNWKIENWSAERSKVTGIVTDWNEGHQILIATPICEIMKRLKELGI